MFSIIEDLLIGTLLGDCYGEKGKNAKTPIFRFKQSSKHEPYIFYLYFILLHWGYTSTNPLKLRSTNDSKGNLHYFFSFNTLAVPELNFIYDLFYSKGKKFISPKLKEFINARVLAYWISDEGSFTGNGILLHTNSFTEKEVTFLIQCLNENLGLNSTIRKNKTQFLIYIKAGSLNKVKQLVKPYMHPFFYYKIGLIKNTKHNEYILLYLRI